MSARNPNTSSGASSPLVKLIPIAVIVIVVLIGLYIFLSGGSKAPAPVAGTQAPAAGAAPAAAPAATAEAPPPAVPDLSPEQLLREAGTAFRENRLVAPAGNNALEYYLALLDKQPNNATARDALREMFPIVTGAVEQNINSGAVDEATRVINLLAKADPSNYTLTILRSKLDAKKKTVEREQAVAAAAAAAAAAKGGQQPAAAAANTAAPAPAAASASAAPPPAESTAAAAAPPKSTTTAPATPAPATTAATAAPPPAAGGDTRAAEILKTSAPDYPPDAVRKRQEGWVEVEFTVMPDGSVANASVVNANPARVFNSSALRAVERWTFKPRVENGKPAEEKMRRRIEFKL